MNFFEQVVLTSVMLSSISVGVFLLYASVVSAIQRQIIQIYFNKLGWRGILLTAWIGTPVHELSHALMAWIFGHRVTKIKLFEPDFETFQLGYVTHVYKKWNFTHKLGCFFIGGAPLIVAPLLVLTLVYIFFPSVYYSIETLSLDASLSALLFEPKTYIVGFIIMSISLHMSPSAKDIVLVKKGMTSLILFWIVLSFVLTSMNITYLDAYTHLSTIFHSFLLLYVATLPVLLLHLVFVKILGR